MAYHDAAAAAVLLLSMMMMMMMMMIMMMVMMMMMYVPLHGYIVCCAVFYMDVLIQIMKRVQKTTFPLSKQSYFCKETRIKLTRFVDSQDCEPIQVSPR